MNRGLIDREGQVEHDRSYYRRTNSNHLQSPGWVSIRTSPVVALGHQFLLYLMETINTRAKLSSYLVRVHYPHPHPFSITLFSLQFRAKLVIHSLQADLINPGSFARMAWDDLCHHLTHCLLSTFYRLTNFIRYSLTHPRCQSCFSTHYYFLFSRLSSHNTG